MNRMDDDLDDLPLPQRARRADAYDGPRSAMRDDMQERTLQPEREFTLSTGTVLALFFGLALVCAVFFGFGYSMGKKAGNATALATAAAPPNTTDGSSESPATKPAAALPAQPVPAYQGANNADAGVQPYKPSAATPAKGDKATTAVTLPLDNPAPAKTKVAAQDDPDGKIVEAPVGKASAAVDPAPGVTPGGTVYVQVAAVSHKEDADALLSALKRRGYTVFTRSSDADKLIHVQLGPFANKKDADAMRQRLLGDGYNAIVK